MQRIDNATAVAARPAPAAPGTPGYFTKGSPGGGVPATIVDDDFLNMIQEELMAVVVAAGLTPDKTNVAQLLTALRLFTRKKLTANTTFYVATGGSNANDGLTVGTPWATRQFAYDTIKNTYDLAGFTATVQVADGTYTDALTADGPVLGGKILFQGNVGTPANCVINVAAGTPFSVQNYASIGVNGFKLTGAQAFNASGYGTLQFQNIEFGACTAYHIVGSGGGLILCGGNYKISGGAPSHIGGNCLIIIQNVTITLTGTPNFSGAFVSVGGVTLYIAGNTFVGGATGVRYSVTLNGVIITGGGGASYLPGNSAGSTATGGQYA